MPVAGGREQDVLLQIKGRNWVVLSDGIYIIESGVSSSLVPVRQGEGYFYRFATRNLEKLGFVTPHIMNGNGMCLSHDGRWAFYAMAESLGSDLMLVENFR
jgi:sugar lactone lactonase YvrE